MAPKKFVLVCILSLVEQQESEAMTPGISWIYLSKTFRLGVQWISLP
jgi:hypothetical protein